MTYIQGVDMTYVIMMMTVNVKNSFLIPYYALIKPLLSFNHKTELLNAALTHYLSLFLLLKVLTSNDNCTLPKNKQQKMLKLYEKKKCPFS